MCVEGICVVPSLNNVDGGADGGVDGGECDGEDRRDGGGCASRWKQVPLRTARQADAGVVGGEGMELIFGFAYAPSNSLVVYLVTQTSRVWKSTDGGRNWRPKSNGLLARGGVSVAVDPSDENTVLVAGSLHRNWAGPDSSTDGIWRSTNGGESWSQVRVTHFQRQRTGAHFAFVGTGSRVYAATHDDGVLRSSDHGATWSALGLLAGQHLRDIKAEANGGALVAAPTGLYRITTGVPPQAVALGGASLPEAPAAVVIHPADARIIYVTVPGSGVFKSTNGGVDFVPKSLGLEPVFNAHSGVKVSYLAMSAVNPARLYVSFDGAAIRQPYYSDDSGESWKEPADLDPGGLASGLTHGTSDVGFREGGPVVASPSDERVAISMAYPPRPVVSSDGGRTWSFSSSGFTGAQGGWTNSSVAWGSQGRMGRFLLEYGPFLSTDGGATFNRMPIPIRNNQRDTVAGAIDPTPGSQVIVVALGTFASSVPAITRNDGLTWTVVDRFADGGSTEDDYTFGVLQFHPQNANIIYANQLKSTDKGLNWRRLPRKVSAVLPSNGDIVYSLNACEVAKSTNGGESWLPPGEAFTPNCENVSSVAIDSGDGDRLYIAHRLQGVYVREPSGWVHRTEADGLGRDEFGVHAQHVIATDPTRRNVVYTGSYFGWRGHSNGIFMSSDGGRSWRNINHNLGPQLNVTGLHVDPYSGDLYMNSTSGLWRLSRPE